MSSETLDIKTLSSGSTTKTVVMIIGGVLVLAGVAFIFYIIFNNPVADALGGLFSFGTSFAKGVESAFSDCFGGGNWNANCLWMYLGALVVVAYGIAKVASFSTAGSSDVVKQFSFETGKSNSETADIVTDYYNQNKETIEKTIEDNGYTADEAQAFRQMVASENLKNRAVEESKAAGGDYESVNKRMANAQTEVIDKTCKEKGIDSEKQEEMEEEAKNITEE